MHEEYTFNGQREKEAVKYIIRNHPFILFWPGIKTIFFLTLAVSTILFIKNQLSGAAALVCFVIAIGVFSRALYDYIQSVLIITSERLINVEQNGYFKRRITETELSNIQGVSSETNGLFKIMLKYGDLVVRTAGTNTGGEILVKNIGNPYEVQQKIAKLKS